MTNTTTIQDLYECMVSAIEESALSWNRLTSIATGGARALRGENVDIVKLLEDKIRKDNPNQAFLPFHCILHQEILCKSGLNLKHVVDPVVSVVSTMRARTLNHRKFKSLRRTWRLSMGKFSTTTMYNPQSWQSAEATDVFEKLNELNVKMQGKEPLAHEMYKHVKSFQAKSSLFSRQASESKFTHFSLLGKEKVPVNVCSKIKDQLKSLTEEFERRFEDFRQNDLKFNLLTSPFSADVDAASDELQLELIDIQSDHSLKETFHSLPLVEFYKLFSVKCSPFVRNFAAR
ncbi:general transcription factor II-I repeat domain-containing protein 2B-like [Penaeus monodon]|uniref:general transcription factor II-I repeat domain-containing protein 2B-like n=1 Tax=Penaeus monodon TaxID=6687 RepID=UPI0018A70A7F|nr:general transcription factor II-I repeat domain-containing protein 2B-like [Penaeus monodon]